MPVWVGYAAMVTGLVPLAVVVWYRTAITTQSAYWWLAGAFGVSFLADLAGLFGGGYLASQTYPLLQAGLVALVIAPRPIAVLTIGALAFISAVSLAWRMAAGLDVLLHVAAWGSTAALASRNLTPGPLRATLVWGFALLSLAWVGFRLEPTFLAWGVMQGVRLAMALGFAWAVREAARAQ